MTLPIIISGTPCTLCGRQAQDIAHIISRAQAPEKKLDPRNQIPVCRECHEAHDNRKEFEWERKGDYLFIVKPGTNQEISRVPIIYADDQYEKIPVEDWIGRASLGALEELCSGLDDKQAQGEELRCRIAAELHSRMAFYGSRWYELAGNILHRSPDTVRQYALIWARLGHRIEESGMGIGVNLLRAAAASDDPEGAFDYFLTERHAGRSVKALLQERVTCEVHEWRCHRCGAERNDEGVVPDEAVLVGVLIALGHVYAAGAETIAEEIIMAVGTERLMRVAVKHEDIYLPNIQGTIRFLRDRRRSREVRSEGYKGMK